MGNIVVHRIVSLFERVESIRVTMSVSTMIGDMRVVVAGTHVGKGRNSVAVRAQDILFRKKSISHYLGLIYSTWTYDKTCNNSRSKEEGDDPSLIPKCVNRGSPPGWNSNILPQ